MISIVFPVYRSSAYIEKIYNLILNLQSLQNNFEIIFVNDGCPENSWEIIERLALNDKRVVGVNLSRNFGQHFAITAGLEVSSGDYVVVMDCDLQEDPREIPVLLEAMDKNKADVVLTLRKKRAHGKMKNFQAKSFYLLMSLLGAQNEFGERVGTFSCLSRKAVVNYLRYNDVHRHYLMLVRTMGFKTCYVEISHYPRENGKSSYSFLALLKHSLDGLVFQSNRLLKFAIFIGLGFICLSFLISIKLTIGYFVHGSIPGYTSLAVSILICTGVVLFMLGIQGIYIGKIFDQARCRPIYIIDKVINRG